MSETQVWICKCGWVYEDEVVPNKTHTCENCGREYETEHTDGRWIILSDYEIDIDTKYCDTCDHEVVYTPHIMTNDNGDLTIEENPSGKTVTKKKGIEYYTCKTCGSTLEKHDTWRIVGDDEFGGGPYI